jgi:hypothetical protein
MGDDWWFYSAREGKFSQFNPMWKDFNIYYVGTIEVEPK